MCLCEFEMVKTSSLCNTIQNLLQCAHYIYTYIFSHHMQVLWLFAAPTHSTMGQVLEITCTIMQWKQKKRETTTTQQISEERKIS